jgi:hypothetical protein
MGMIKCSVLVGLLVAGVVMPAVAQTAPTPVRLRGTITAVAGTTLTIAGAGGTTSSITLPPGVRITYYVKAALDKVAAGSFIGAVAEPLPDGALQATAIQIFPPGFSANPGSGPWDSTATSTMTNGTIDTIAATKVDKVNASVLNVTYQGGAKSITITPKTSIVAVVPADPAALTPGAHVLVFAVKAADGTLTARAVGVGKDGLIPPL